MAKKSTKREMGEKLKKNMQKCRKIETDIVQPAKKIGQENIKKLLKIEGKKNKKQQKNQ